MDNKQIALNFAKENGFVSVDFQESLHGYDIFIAQPLELLIVGYPFFILVKNGLARESKTSELFKIMGFSDVPNLYTEKLI